MSNYLVQVNQQISILNRHKNLLFVFAVIFLPLFLFFFSGQTIYASMNSADAFHKDGMYALKPLAVADAPTIDIWYGDEQEFGHIGNPQQWVNILGNVSDTDGIATLTYTLNGGAAVPLSVGPDNRRLALPGDFNVDIAQANLISGTNEVVITAVDDLGNSASKTVSVTYQTGNVWPATYSIDWSAVSDIQSVAQVVDGEWQLTGDGVRSYVPDYDRLIGIGDVTWTDYEVVVPITIHSIDPGGFGGASYKPNVGVVMRWTGHTDDPVGGMQPKSGYYPAGIIAWWEWDSLSAARLGFFDTGDTPVDTPSTPQLGTQYMMKVRVDSVVSQGGNYKVKIWESGDPEPVDWDLTYQTDASNLANGSMLLISHHVDATFGDVSIYPTGTPITYDLATAVSGNGSITANPNQTSFDAGETVTVTAVPATDWLFNGWSGDVSSIDNPLTLTMDGHKNITATFVEESNPSHTLTINTVGNGTVEPTPHQLTYTPGQVVTLTAVPDIGWLFDSWDGALTGTTNPQSLIMDGDKEITGTFVIDTPVISNIAVYTLPTKAIIQWQTDEAANSQVDFGSTDNYELGPVSSSEFVQTHTLIIPNLNPNTTYHYKITSVNAYNGTTTTADAVFTTSSDGSGIVSDDFNAGTLNSSLWTFVNPVGDGSTTMNGTELSLHVPGNSNHDVWENGNDSVRIMQPANDTDFEIEVKFASPVTTRYQMQGLLIEEDDGNFLRFDYYGSGGSTYLFAASFTAGAPTALFDEQLFGWNAPMYMRVTRVDDLWFIWISLDGDDWDLVMTFTHTLTVSQVGTFAANAPGVGTIPAQTAVVDYFFNTASPIDPEDANAQPLVLTTNTVGSGTVARIPNQTNFAYGDVVTLTATADPDNFFNYWSGAATGSSNPVTVTMDTDKTVTANFLSDAATSYALTKTVAGSGVITAQPDQVRYLPGDVVTVTAAADFGWDFSAWSGAISGAANPQSIIMDDNKSVTATFLPDQTPPVISNIQIIPASTQAIIAWNTDEPANSAVAYGLTTGYELGTVSKAPYVITHSVTITGLTPETTYHFQITSVDEHGNSGSTTDATFTTAGANVSGIVSDDFNTHTISNTIWTLVDPVGDGSASQNGTQLLLTVPAGTEHDLWDGGNNSLRLMQSVADEDFEVEVKFESDLNQEYQIQGILVEQDAINYLRFDFYYEENSDDPGIWILGAAIVDGDPETIVNEHIALDYPAPMFMRLKRIGDNWTFSICNNGCDDDENWEKWGEAPDPPIVHPMTMNGIGVFAANASELPAHTAVVDYFFNTAEPIFPEDANDHQYTLDTNVVGQGDITVNPLKGTYDFNEVVTVTAVPDSGWVFNGWSGAVTGSTASKTITMNSNKAITATFIEESAVTYDLTINPSVGNGSVEVTPDKVSYLPGEVVTVTAVPGAGWKFANWSGASTSTSSSIQVTMNANKSLTATFTPQTFTVTKASIGNGNVTIVPNLPNYSYGQVITITAHPANGWVFDHWSGIINTDNPRVVTVTGNLTVTAVFEELEVEEYLVFLPMVIKP